MALSSAANSGSTMVWSRSGPVETMPIFAPLSRSWKAKVLLGGLGQLVEFGDALGGLTPALERGVARLDRLKPVHVGGNFIGHLPVDLVADADGNFFELVENIQLGDHQPLRAVDLVGVAQHRNVEPAAAPRTAGYRAVLVAALAQQIAGGIVNLGGERPAADARDVGLGDGDDSANVRWVPRRFRWTRHLL